MLRRLVRIMNLTEDEIMNHPTLIVNIFDREHRLLYWNKQCEVFFRIAEADALGKKFEDIVPQAKGHQNQVFLDRALQGESVIVDYTPFENKAGGFTQTILPLNNFKGKALAAVSITREVTGGVNEEMVTFNTKGIRVSRQFFAASAFS